jgi:uncharacterized damage-inducible protein DinB
MPYGILIMNPESIRVLYDYNYWAFERVWACTIPLSDEQFVQPLDYSMGSIRNHTVHLMSATQRWIKRLQKTDVPAHLAYEDYPTRTETKAMWDVLKTATLDYMQSLDQMQLDEIISWELPARNLNVHNRRWEVLLHVANHSTDHRAQMLAMLNQQFGVKTVEQDLILYLAEGH